MTSPDDLKWCLDGLGTGVALVAPKSWAVIYENTRFGAWFPSTNGADALPDRLPSFDSERAVARLDRGRPYSFEAKAGEGARAVSLAIEVRRAEADGAGPLLVECRDISGQKQAEYMLDSYSRLAEKHARDLQREKERVEKLLLNIMPRSVYEEMRDFGMATPQRFDSASVLMLDFVGFTGMAISQDPSAIVAELNDIFSAFDRIVELFGCERIKTIGDGYVAVSGLPEPNADHAVSIAKAALRMRRYLEKRNAAHSTQWRCRIGLATGPLIGSLVGIQKYVYDIFGPAVNLAARLEALAEPMRITLPEETYRLIRDSFEPRALGEFDLRGFDRQSVYALEREARVGG